MNVIDASLFFNEFSLATFRVSYLDGVVHRHYFFEACFTHSGDPKELHLRDSGVFEEHPGVEVIEIPLPESLLEHGSRWAIEEYSRDWAMRFVAERHPSDFVILADVDEIPSRDQIRRAVEISSAVPLVSFPLAVHYRSANLVSKELSLGAKGFIGTKAKPGIRFLSGEQVGGERGAHLRYMGYDSLRLVEKHSAFAHGELDVPELEGSDLLAFADRFLISHLPRFWMGDFGILSLVGREELGEVARTLATQYPHLLRDPRSIPPISQRMAASLALAEGYRRPEKLLRTITQKSGKFGVGSLITTSVAALLVRGQILKAGRVFDRVVRYVFSTDRAPGRRLVHVVRGVYRHGDQLRLVQRSINRI